MIKLYIMIKLMIKLKIVLLGKFMLKGQRSKRNCVFAAWEKEYPRVLFANKWFIIHA